MAKMEETREMAKLFESGLTMQEIGDRYGISRQSVQQRFKSAGLDRLERLSKYALIDKARLEILYSEKQLPIDKIGAAFGVNSYLIQRALEFHQITKRRSIKSNGKHVSLLRKLQVGEKTEIECRARKPYVVLHAIAARLGAKIAMRKIEDGRFWVTKIV